MKENLPYFNEGNLPYFKEYIIIIYLNKKGNEEKKKYKKGDRHLFGVWLFFS